MFEKAKWIGGQDDIKTASSPLFRKTLTIGNTIKSAVLNVCGLGYGVYYINGKRVTKDVLITPFTRFDKRVLYNTYDVRELLSEGENCIGVMLGNGWYNDIAATWDYEKADWRHYPKLIFQLDIIYESNEIQSIVSNSSWKTADGPIIYNHVRCGELYDARMEIAGWNEVDFDDNLWRNAFVCRGAGGVFEPVIIPPIRIVKTLSVKSKIGNVYDFGQNISGWVKIRVKGKRGSEIKIKYSERLNADGSIDTENINMFNFDELKHTDIYILKGEGTEEWEPSFVYHGFRYVEVLNATDDFEIEARVVHTDINIIGEFECSDDMLNKIHNAARWSTLTNYHGIPTDCPHREQNGWTGDALLSAEQALMNYDIAQCYKKWLRDFKDVQRPNGQLPGIIPTSAWGYNWGSGPAWDSAIILIPYYIYFYTGDKSAIEDMWDNMKLYMAYLDSMSEDDIVNFGLGDWCSPENAKVCSSDVTDTAYYYVDAKIMAYCAKALGRESKSFEELAAKIKKAFRERFINDGIVEGDCQTSIACGIYQGLYEPKEIPAAAAYLAKLVEEKDYHIDCGILGTKYIFTALSDNGYADIAYKMVVNPTMPSYAYWINSGMTTLCEDWEMKSSLNHHMFSEVDFWFYKYLAGIQISPNGLVIKPCFIDGLKWVRAKYKDIEVFWNKEMIEVKAPCNCTLIVRDKKIKLSEGVNTYSMEEF